MTEVISFFFSTLTEVWSVIYDNWLLAIGFMIAVISYIVGLINSSKSEK